MGNSRVALHSNAFPGKYLRLDGQGVDKFLGAGGGKVSTGNSIGPQETFFLVRYDDGTVSFESTVFKNVFLRLNGDGVPAGKELPDGGGVVNAQFGSITSEKFKIVQKKPKDPNTYNGIVGIESNQFSGRFLRVNGKKDQVNVQGVFLDFEEWEILVIG